MPESWFGMGDGVSQRTSIAEKTVLRVSKLKSAFHAAYPGQGEALVCRAPGRVNLIGEHTDYNGLPVLPMTLAQEIRIAFRCRQDGKITLRDENPEFGEVSFFNEPELPPSPPGSWDNYCKAAVQGLNRHFKRKEYPGMDMLVSSDLPIAAGLSSSSALVVACGLAYLRVLGYTLEKDISRVELAELMAEAEHYVGTRGGGMDQAVILNGLSNHACKIDFFPLRVEIAPLPEGCAVVVCDSMVKVKKSGSALARYNAGPRLCALACALVERQLQEDFGEEVELPRLGDLWYGPLCLTHREASALCTRAIPKALMSLAETATRLNSTPDEVRERWLGDLPEPAEGFRLQARLRHQLTEYRRVETARDALLAGDSDKFGCLMNASHESCANDFQISSVELDALVQAARQSGAIGARLTGAGFGGATVNLVPEDRCEEFIQGVGEGYYRQRRGHDGPPPVFVGRSSDGAGYL
jgi:N-acetylgalactosamine kinase